MLAHQAAIYTASLALSLITLLSGCASWVRAAPESAKTVVDPWERLNRTDYAIQGKLDLYLVHPLGKVYRFLTPGLIGRSIHNVLVNLSEPAALFNDLLQFRGKRAATPAARLLINSTFGVLGLVDVAALVGLYHHDNEFGVTLGRYGVLPGPYVYLPMIGPSTTRDLVGGGVDFLLDPVRWLDYRNKGTILDLRLELGGLDKQATTDAELRALLSTAVDPYATLRSAFLQHKQGEIEGDGVPLDLPSFDEPVSGPGPAPTAIPPAGPTAAPELAPDGEGNPEAPAVAAPSDAPTPNVPAMPP